MCRTYLASLPFNCVQESDVQIWLSCAWTHSQGPVFAHTYSTYCLPCKICDHDSSHLICSKFTNKYPSWPMKEKSLESVVIIGWGFSYGASSLVWDDKGGWKRGRRWRGCQYHVVRQTKRKNSAILLESFLCSLAELWRFISSRVWPIESLEFRYRAKTLSCL